MLLNERSKRFRIIARLSVLIPKPHALSGDDSKEMQPWCLIAEESASSSSGSRVRWIEESLVQEWVKEGSSLVGGWPQPLQEVWEYSLSALKSELEQQRDDLSFRLDEVNAAFQAYKIRAQSALKRIGNEDRNEKQRAHENEVIALQFIKSKSFSPFSFIKLTQEVEKLKLAVKALESDQQTAQDEISSLQIALEKSEAEVTRLGYEAEALKKWQAAALSTRSESERQLRELSHELELLRAEKSSVEELLQESVLKHSALLQQFNIAAHDLSDLQPSLPSSSSSRFQEEGVRDAGAVSSIPSGEESGSGHASLEREKRVTSNHRQLQVATATAIEMADVVDSSDDPNPTPVSHLLPDCGPSGAGAKEPEKRNIGHETSEAKREKVDGNKQRASPLNRQSPPQVHHNQTHNKSDVTTNAGGKMLLHQQAEQRINFHHKFSFSSYICRRTAI